MTFDPASICRILNEESVDYVVVGGFGAVIHGSPLPTEDIDIIPSRTPSNLERLAVALERLAVALERLGAQIRTEDEPVPARLDAAFLSQMPHMLNLVTAFGILDLAFTPAGPRKDYEAWDAGASSVEIADLLIIRVASLDDIIDSKKAASRAKDLLAIPYLESLRDTIASTD